MHQNYYFLKRVSASLTPLLVGKRLLECYSQKGDEVILGFADEEDKFYVKAILSPRFSGVCFPEQQAKPKRFFVNLFKEVHGKKVVAIKQLLNERSFEIHLEDDYCLVFQFFGRRSNLLLTKESEFIGSYRKTIIEDAIKKDRVINQSKETFYDCQGDVFELFPTLGKKSMLWLTEKGFEGKDIEGKWNLLQELLLELESDKCYMSLENDFPELLLMPPTNSAVTVYENPLEASTQFVYRYLKAKHTADLKGRIVKKLTTEINQLKNYVTKVSLKLKEIQTGLGYKERADIVMANLHQIQQGVEQVELFNFYTNENVIITLKKELSPQKNAENFYRKSKNKRLEIENLATNLNQKSTRIEKLEQILAEINSLEDFLAVKNWAKEHGYLNEGKEEAAEKPFKVFEVDGYVIYVGKNAVNNDLLTLKFASKDDLWLHAKDVSGSHTVIKTKAGNAVPQQTIEKVAAIAAYYSKRKSDSLCPVIVTPKKYVRKRKGAPAGQVVVERERVVLVKPGLPNS